MHGIFNGITYFRSALRKVSGTYQVVGALGGHAALEEARRLRFDFRLGL